MYPGVLREAVQLQHSGDENNGQGNWYRADGEFQKAFCAV